MTLLDGPFYDLLDPPPRPPRSWTAQARPEQLPPEGDWFIWLLMAGRGWGKTRTGAEWILENALRHPNTEWAIIGKTIGQARDVCVENKHSGVLRCAQEGEIVRYVANPCQIDLVNKARIYVHGSEDEDRVRGYSLSGAWCDELASWPYPRMWHEGLAPGMRDLSTRPHVVVTTTPKPRPLLRELLEHPKAVVVRGSTYDNAANLSPEYIAEMHASYDGTRLGEQEIHGKVLDDNPGALWQWADIEAGRTLDDRYVPDMERIVVGVDPAVTSSETSDETGIVIAGKHAGQFYILADYSLRATPHEWANKAIAGYQHFTADLIVGEMNNGGDLIETTLRTIAPNVAYLKVHASRGKQIRAEPVAALYEQHRVHHCGHFAELEDQMTTWDPTDNRAKSPDRVDALVWAVTTLAEPSARSVF